MASDLQVDINYPVPELSTETHEKRFALNPSETLPLLRPLPKKMSNFRLRYGAITQCEQQAPHIEGLLPKIRNWYADYWYTIYFSFITLLVGACFSLQGPFFPYLALTNGFTPEYTSIVYVAFEIANLLGVLIIGSQIRFKQSKLVLACGLFVFGGTNILFGALQWIKNISFLILAGLIRIIEAFGRAAIFASIFNEMGTKNLSRFPYASVVLCFCFSCGMILGPAIGTVLNTVNFFLPFAFFGSLFVIPLIILKGITLPRDPETSIREILHRYREIPPTIKKIAGTYDVMVCMIMIITSAMSYAYIVLAMQIHLRKRHDDDDFLPSMIYASHGAGIAMVGLIAVVLRYSITDYPLKAFYIMDCLFAGAGLFLMEHKVEHATKSVIIVETIFGAILHGWGISALVSSYMNMCVAAIRRNFQELNFRTYRAVAIIWMSCFSIGALVGFIASGFIVKYIDFHVGFSFPASCHGVAAIAILIISTIEYFTPEQYTPSEIDEQEQREQLPQSATARIRNEIRSSIEALIHPVSASTGLSQDQQSPDNLELTSSGHQRPSVTQEPQIESSVDESAIPETPQPSTHFVIDNSQELTNDSNNRDPELDKESGAVQGLNGARSHLTDASTSTQSPIEPNFQFTVGSRTEPKD